MAATAEEREKAAAAAEADVNPEEEYRVWKKNTPYLYDFVIAHALEWPSLTVQWLPAHSSSSASSPSVQNLILGTHTSGGSPNFLMVAELQLAPPYFHPVVRILQRIPHQGEVNRARYMPQNPSLIATKTCGSEVHLFNRNSRPPSGGGRPDLILKGHSKEGFGISWSPLKEGYLLSGSNDSKICLWDVSRSLHQGGSLDAKDVYEAHEDVVEDVSWHSKNENLFGSVGDDRRLMIWDLRSSTSKTPQHSVVAHENEVNTLSFSPFNEWILATGSDDTTICLFDLRKLTASLHSFSSHTDKIVQVEWNPNNETILGSGAADKRLMVWDVSRIGDEQSAEDAEDGPPELLFVHGGHRSSVSEFSWNCSKPWVGASVDENNFVHIWQMAESIYSDDKE